MDLSCVYCCCLRLPNIDHLRTHALIYVLSLLASVADSEYNKIEEEEAGAPLSVSPPPVSSGLLRSSKSAAGVTKELSNTTRDKKKSISTSILPSLSNRTLQKNPKSALSKSSSHVEVCHLSIYLFSTELNLFYIK